MIHFSASCRAVCPLNTLEHALSSLSAPTLKETWKTATRALAQLDKTNLNRSTQPHQTSLFSIRSEVLYLFSFFSFPSFAKTNAFFCVSKNTPSSLSLTSSLSLPVCRFRVWKSVPSHWFSSTQSGPFYTRETSLMVSSPAPFSF